MVNINALFSDTFVRCISQYLLRHITFISIQQLRTHLFTWTTEIICNDVLSARDITYCESIWMQSQTLDFVCGLSVDNVNGLWSLSSVKRCPYFSSPKLLPVPPSHLQNNSVLGISFLLAHNTLFLFNPIMHLFLCLHDAKSFHESIVTWGQRVFRAGRNCRAPWYVCQLPHGVN